MEYANSKDVITLTGMVMCKAKIWKKKYWVMLQ